MHGPGESMLKILRDKQKIAMDKLERDQENSAYLEELKKKL